LKIPASTKDCSISEKHDRKITTRWF